MKELVEKDEDGPLMAQGRRCEFDFAFKAGFGSGEIIGLETDTKRLEGCSGQVTDGTTEGMCEERGQGERAQHGRLSAFVWTRQECMTFFASQAEGERDAMFRSEMEIVRISKIKDRFDGVGHPLDGMDIGEMIELEMDFELSEIRQSQLTIGGMEESVSGGVGGGKIVGKRTTMVFISMFFQALVQDLVPRLQLDPLASIGFGGLVDRVEMLIRPVGLYDAL